MTNTSKYLYEVDENNAVRIWDSEVTRDGGNPPQIFQPDYPNGNPFESAEAAGAWAETYINTVVTNVEVLEDTPEEPTE
jgi:hypothetical protein